MSPEISVCIPVLIRNQKDISYFSELLSSISLQIEVNIEVSISIDRDSLLDRKKITSLMPKNIRNVASMQQNTETGISLNTNSAIRNASNEICKVIYQDDFFCDNLALMKIAQKLSRSNKKWLVNGSNHFEESTGTTKNPMIPKISRKLFHGINTVSGPSVVALKKSSFLPFSDKLSLMLDCEWYLRMTHNFGKPLRINEILVTNRIHPEQAQHKLRDVLEEEVKLVSNMHSSTKTRTTSCRCSTLGHFS